MTGGLKGSRVEGQEVMKVEGLEVRGGRRQEVTMQWSSGHEGTMTEGLRAGKRAGWQKGRKAGKRVAGIRRRREGLRFGKRFRR